MNCESCSRLKGFGTVRFTLYLHCVFKPRFNLVVTVFARNDRGFMKGVWEK
ncbi:MAG: hypothetical protein Q7T80_08165 [Methanoregula sp.]|nr:hypothetical protein [Methanoregula sp.]